MRRRSLSLTASPGSRAIRGVSKQGESDEAVFASVWRTRFGGRSPSVAAYLLDPDLARSAGAAGRDML